MQFLSPKIQIVVSMFFSMIPVKPEALISSFHVLFHHPYNDTQVFSCIVEPSLRW